VHDETHRPPRENCVSDRTLTLKRPVGSIVSYTLTSRITSAERAAKAGKPAAQGTTSQQWVAAPAAVNLSIVSSRSKSTTSACDASGKQARQMRERAQEGMPRSRNERSTHRKVGDARRVRRRQRHAERLRAARRRQRAGAAAHVTRNAAQTARVPARRSPPRVRVPRPRCSRACLARAGAAARAAAGQRSAGDDIARRAPAQARLWTRIAPPRTGRAPPAAAGTGRSPARSGRRRPPTKRGCALGRRRRRAPAPPPLRLAAAGAEHAGGAQRAAQAQQRAARQRRAARAGGVRTAQTLARQLWHFCKVRTRVRHAGAEGGRHDDAAHVEVLVLVRRAAGARDTQVRPDLRIAGSATAGCGCGRRARSAPAAAPRQGHVSARVRARGGEASGAHPGAARRRGAARHAPPRRGAACGADAQRIPSLRNTLQPTRVTQR
jgi:hypothetical protein